MFVSLFLCCFFCFGFVSSLLFELDFLFRVLILLFVFLFDAFYSTCVCNACFGGCEFYVCVVDVALV